MTKDETPSQGGPLDALLASIEMRLEAGEAVDLEAEIQRHPEFEAQIRSFWRNREAVRGLGLGVWLRGAAENETAIAGPLSPFGDFEEIVPIGAGGMGLVYRARQKSLHRVVALKFIRWGALATAVEKERFRREARAVALLDHENIVPVFAFERDGERDFFIMPFLDGGSLESSLAQSLPAPRDFAALLEVVARAVHHAHERGIIHRDLKPGNILFDRGGKPYVADFGLAKLLNLDGADEPGLSATNSAVGTPAYMAPEQINESSSSLTVGVDVYSLGVILYRGLSGRLPFEADSRYETMRRIVDEEPRPPSVLRPGLPRDLESICLKCLEKLPAKRYRSALELAEELRRFREGKPVLARPIGTFERAARWARRRPAVAALMAVSALFVVGFLGLLLYTNAELRISGEAALKNETKALAEARRLQRVLFGMETRYAFQTLASRDFNKTREIFRDLNPVGSFAGLDGFDYHRLQRLIQKDDWDRGFLAPVTSIAVTRDARRVIIGRANKEAIESVSDSESEEYFRAKLSFGGWRGVLLSPDVQRLWVLDEGGSVTIWSASPSGLKGANEVKDWIEKGRFGSTSLNARCFALSPDGKRLVTGHADGALRVWDTENEACVDTIVEGQSPIRNLVFSPIGNDLLSGSDEGALRLRHLNEGTSEELLPRLPAPVFFSAISSDGKMIAAAHGDRTIHLWEGGTHQGSLPAQEEAVNCLAFSPDGRFLVSGGADARLVVWDPRRRVRLHTFEGHGRAINCLAFHPDGRRVFSGSEESTVRLWDLSILGEKQALEEPAILEGHEEMVTYIGDLPGGRGTVTASGDFHLILWNREDGKGGPFLRHQGDLWPSPEEAKGACMGTLSPDGRYAGIGYKSGALRVFRTGAETGSFQKVEEPLVGGFETSIVALRFSPDSSIIAASNIGGDVLCYQRDATGNAPTWRIKHRFHLQEFSFQEVDRLFFSRDSRFLAAASAEKMATIVIYDVTKGTIRARLSYAPGPITSLTFSADSSFMVFGGYGPALLLWEIAAVPEGGVTDANKDLRHFLTDLSGASTLLSMTPDGKFLAIADSKGNFALMDLIFSPERLQGITRMLLPGHGDPIRTFSFSADQQILLIGGGPEKGGKGDLQMWRAAPPDFRRPGR